MSRASCTQIWSTERGDVDGVVVGQLRGAEALVEAGRVVVLALADAEVGRGRPLPLRSFSHGGTLPVGGDSDGPRIARVFAASAGRLVAIGPTGH